MNPTQYTVKAGDTLNSIANAHGFSDYKAANIQGFGANPDAITPGQVLTLGGVPKTSEIPGIGTLTVTPKNIPTTPPASDTGNVDPSIAGAYARAGLTPPTTPLPAGTANGYKAPAVAGLPTYPSTTNSSDYVAQIKQSYADTLKTISDLESKISGSSAPSQQELDLQNKLNDAKAKLAQFDVGTLSAEEGLSGQGRGATLGAVNTEKTILDRTRALQRLGLATDADTIATQLSTAQNARTAQGDVAKTQYDLATKKLDMALNVEGKLDSLSKQDQQNSRQYLLDVVNFAEGKTFDQLDPATQEAITAATADSPLSLGLVKTALKSGADKAAQTAAGTLRDVGGVGLVRVKPDGSYDVVIPSNAGNGGFSTTQENKGAANAGIAIKDFSGLDSDTKNYFINTFPSSQLEKDLKAMGTSSGKSPQQIADDVSNSNLSDAIKQTVYKRLGVQPGQGGSSSGGFLSGAWDNIRGFLGI